MCMHRKQDHALPSLHNKPEIPSAINTSTAISASVLNTCYFELNIRLSFRPKIPSAINTFAAVSASVLYITTSYCKLNIRLSFCEMESQKQIQQEDGNGGCGCVGGSNKSSFLCRQSSTRWIPTAEQIRILRELYYNNGVRSPSAEQIQRISARLRQYGKIEGKNVFYWFQNHKARERQKKRLSSDLAVQQQRCTAGWSSSDDFSPKITSSTALNTNSAGVSSYGGSLVCVGQMSGIGCGSVLMERGGLRGGFRSGTSGMTGTSTNSYECFGQHDSGETQGTDGDIETLQLFPLRGEDSGIDSEKPEADEPCYPAWYFGDIGGDQGASLELTLSSFPAGDGYV